MSNILKKYQSTAQVTPTPAAKPIQQEEVAVVETKVEPAEPEKPISVVVKLSVPEKEVSTIPVAIKKPIVVKAAIKPTKIKLAAKKITVVSPKKAAQKKVVQKAA